jgi:hypothetical protein
MTTTPVDPIPVAKTARLTWLGLPEVAGVPQ